MAVQACQLLLGIKNNYDLVTIRMPHYTIIRYDVLETNTSVAEDGSLTVASPSHA